MREWVYLPNTGRPIIWQLRIRTAAIGTVHVCGNATFQVGQTVNDFYHAEAGSGHFDLGWSLESDAAAFGGHAAKATRGTFASFENDVFGNPVVPFPRAYDVWYRVKVKDAGGASAQMMLGLWDDQAGAWAASSTYTASQIGTGYLWVRVATAVTPALGHSVQFVASFIFRLGTDWYIDEAVMVPSASRGGPDKPS